MKFFVALLVVVALFGVALADVEAVEGEEGCARCAVRPPRPAANCVWTPRTCSSCGAWKCTAPDCSAVRCLIPTCPTNQYFELDQSVTCCAGKCVPKPCVMCTQVVTPQPGPNCVYVKQTCSACASWNCTAPDCSAVRCAAPQCDAGLVFESDQSITCCGGKCVPAPEPECIFCIQVVPEQPAPECVYVPQTCTACASWSCPEPECVICAQFIPAQPAPECVWVPQTCTTCGAWSCPAPAAPAVPICGTRGAAACPTNQYCSFPASAQCGRADAPGTCKPKPELCTFQYTPVCGCDGVTYSNECSATSAGVSVEYTGECGSNV